MTRARTWTILLLGLATPACSDNAGTAAEAGGGSATAGLSGNGGGGGAVSSGGSNAGVAGLTQSVAGGGGASGASVGGGAVGGGMAGAPPGGAGGSAGSGGAGGEASAPFPGCPNCRRIFDGKTLDGWTPQPANGWDVKDESIHITGAGRGYIYTKDDYADYRVIFSVRQVVGDHDPCVLFFAARPPPALDALGAVQFQLPNHYAWDYRPGHNDDGGKLFTPQPHPQLDKKKWNQCEILAKASTGEAWLACCELVGSVPCKGVEHNRFKDPTAGKKGPFALQSHNGGIQDEYKDIFVETNPTVDTLISVQ